MQTVAIIIVYLSILHISVVIIEEDKVECLEGKTLLPLYRLENSLDSSLSFHTTSKDEYDEAVENGYTSPTVSNYLSCVKTEADSVALRRYFKSDMNKSDPDDVRYFYTADKSESPNKTMQEKWTKTKILGYCRPLNSGGYVELWDVVLKESHSRYLAAFERFKTDVKAVLGKGEDGRYNQAVAKHFCRTY